MIPGGKEEWRIKVKNAAGKGADAEFLATMYDESLDAFRANKWDFSDLSLLFLGFHLGNRRSIRHIIRIRIS